MGLLRFQIVFDSNHGVYYTGQHVTGSVFVVLDAPKRVRGVSLKAKGAAAVRWDEWETVAVHQDVYHVHPHPGHQGVHHGPHHGVHHVGPHHHYTTRKKLRTYHSEELYFEHNILLFPGGQEQTLPAGEHCFPFGFLLPAGAPSSFEGEHGHVRYLVRASLERPWKFDHAAKAAFTVVNPLDLNAHPHLNSRIQKSAHKKFCCLCCTSGPLSLVLTLPASGLVPGQQVLPSVEVDNLSNVNVANCRLLFTKTVQFHAQGSTKTLEKTLLEKTLGSVEAGRSHTWLHEPGLEVPALPPSHLHPCRIIDLQYHLKLVAAPVGAHLSLTLTLPVTVGTIPFRQNFAAFQHPPPTLQPAGWNVAPSAPQMDDPPPNYPDLPPPSYEESVLGAGALGEPGEGDHVAGDTTYTPRYPVYTQQA